MPLRPGLRGASVGDMDELTPDPRLLEKFGRKFSAGDVIFREGDAGNEAFLLQEGRVRLLKKVRTVERSLMVLKPGDLFGESALNPGATRSSTAVALTDGVALALAETTFRTLLQNNPAVAARVLGQLVRRLRELEDQIEYMMIRDTQSKIVAALLKLSSGRSGSVLPVTPMDLSTRVGLDVDTVKRTVQQLRDGEYVRISEEKLEIPDVEALRKLYNLLGVKDELQGEKP
ncbi:MAG: Crp/Fnr family transcriptional regulator [Deltaproteobacteria bacterium]|nr:Crp/Fnr family transcriptional regulator [Deltaproteobacteria bacterium]